MSERQDKKGGFVETNSSEYSTSKSKMQGIFESGFASHTIKLQNKTQDHLSNLSTNKTEGVNCILSHGVGRTYRIDTIKKHQ